MQAELLDVVAVYANPMQWQSRLAIHQAFEQQMLHAGVRLTTVECAYGGRPFQLTDHHGQINRVQVRSKTVVWNKENLINIGISRLPHSWKYVGWLDADIKFRNPNWAANAVHALQQYDVIQPWSDAYDLGPKGEHIAAYKSFCRQFWYDKPVFANKKNFWTFDNGPYDYPHSGYAWCATRQALEWVGGLLDTAISGAGDHHMALALVGRADLSVPGGVTSGYMQPITLWQDRALLHINRNIGFCWGTIEHSWHGRKTDRKYVDRWEIIVKNKFNPATDLKKNTYGVWELAGNKPNLAHDMDVYFRQRNEDANSVD